jgi:hypothetical protein
MISDPTPSNSKKASEEKAELRESWHKTVVKILCWKDGLSQQNVITLTDKITPSEWKEYCEKMMSISVEAGKDKTAEKLRKIKEQIQKHNGFA